MSASSSQGGSSYNEQQMTDSGEPSNQDAVAANQGDDADSASISGRSESGNSRDTWGGDDGSDEAISESGSDNPDSGGSESPPVDVHIVPPERMAAGVPPFVAYFANADVDIGMSVAGDCEFSIYEKESAHRRSYTLLGRTDTVDYVGSSRGAEFSIPGPGYAVGLYNRESGTLQVMPLAAGRVFRLEPRVVGIKYGHLPPASDEDEGEGEGEGAETISNKGARVMMADGFTSTRRTRQSRQRDEARISSQRLASSGGLATAQHSMEHDPISSGVNHAKVLDAAKKRRNLPPHHPEAMTWHDAYQLQELMPQAACNALETAPFVAAALEPHKVDSLAEKVPAYVVSRLGILAAEADSSELERRATCLAYLAALLQLHGQAPWVRTKGLAYSLDDEARNRGMRRELLEALMDRFFIQMPPQGSNEEEEKWMMDKPTKGLLLSYALVVALLAESGSLTGEAFLAMQKHLQVDPVELASHFRELGASTLQVTVSGGGLRGKSKAYEVALLPPAKAGEEGRSLGSCFPAIRSGRPTK